MDAFIRENCVFTWPAGEAPETKLFFASFGISHYLSENLVYFGYKFGGFIEEMMLESGNGV